MRVQQVDEVQRMGGTALNSASHIENLDLFSQEHIERMVRMNSGRSEVLAAAAVAPKRSALQRAILQALRTHGPMTDEELERLPQFQHYAPSTVRKRRSELSDPELWNGSARIVSLGLVDRPGRTPITRWSLGPLEECANG